MEPNYQQAGQSQQQPGYPPKNWLVESILVTIFCCLPFGIAGIVFAAQVNSKWSVGDYAGAMQSSKDAAKWTKIGFIIGLVQILLGVIWVAFWGGMAFLFGNGHYSHYNY
jgi:hypothetical protein